MTARKKGWFVGYRSKGPDGTQRTCALMFNALLLSRMVKSDRYALEVESDSSMIMVPHQAGFKMNFKPGSVIGELNIAWTHLERGPADQSGKGQLPCTLTDKNYVRIHTGTWSKPVKDQPSLFEPISRILIPHDSVGTGGVTSALFDD